MYCTNYFYNCLVTPQRTGLMLKIQVDSQLEWDKSTCGNLHTRGVLLAQTLHVKFHMHKNLRLLMEQLMPHNNICLIHGTGMKYT